MTRSEPRCVAVIDIGKTNAKLVLVDIETRREIAVRKRANRSVLGGAYPHADIDGIWEFLCASLAEMNGEVPVDAISITTHGACAALVDQGGNLVLPVLDYEHSGPDEIDDDYKAVRPDFSQSRTPPLPGGLNLAKQLFWQAQRFPAEFARAAWILLYPQYWGFQLTGVAASEITSIGCHTDLWNFASDTFSDLVVAGGWQEKFAPFRPASDVLGPIKPALAKRLGLRESIPVHVGIHDSNASLVPHMISRSAPFSVVSTGTWVVVCAPGGDLESLDPARDSYANIDMLSRHVPSARFMGGREYADLIGDHAQMPDRETIGRVLENKWMLLPSITRGSGPFPAQKAQMTIAPADVSAQANNTIVSFYLAMMTAECLSLAGASGTIVVEGPFVANDVFLQMLHASTGRAVLAQNAQSTGTSVGAALLAVRPDGGTELTLETSVTSRILPVMEDYARDWRKAAYAAAAA